MRELWIEFGGRTKGYRALDLLLDLSCIHVVVVVNSGDLDEEALRDVVRILKTYSIVEIVDLFCPDNTEEWMMEVFSSIRKVREDKFLLRTNGEVIYQGRSVGNILNEDGKRIMERIQ